MAAAPLRPEYGPTLGQLLAPRWRRVSRAHRALVLAGGALLAVALVLGVATVLPPSLSHAGGGAPFNFTYPGLYRVSPAAGDYATVRDPAHGPLVDSFAVAPLTLAPYRGEPSAALALYATRYIATLAARDPGFDLRGEGWTQADSISRYAVYNIFYTATATPPTTAAAAVATITGAAAPAAARNARGAVARQRGGVLYGRAVLLLPERPGARRGVAISMLGLRGSDRQVTSPLLVGAKGVLEGPLTSFALE